MTKMQKYFESIKTTSLINDSWMCAPSCSNKNYKVVEIVEEPITWKTDWISEVFVKLKSESGIEKKTKYYTYEKVIRHEDVKISNGKIRVICWQIWMGFLGCCWVGLSCQF